MKEMRMELILKNGNRVSIDDFIKDNLEAWITIRTSAASASIFDGPYISARLIRAFDAAVMETDKWRSTKMGIEHVKLVGGSDA